MGICVVEIRQREHPSLGGELCTIIPDSLPHDRPERRRMPMVIDDDDSYGVKIAAAAKSGGEAGGAAAGLVAQRPLAFARFETQGLIEGGVPLAVAGESVGPQAGLWKAGEIKREV